MVGNARSSLVPVPATAAVSAAAIALLEIARLRQTIKLDRFRKTLADFVVQLTEFAQSVQKLARSSLYASCPSNVSQNSSLKGKCGICEFKELCGGSRARTHATTGDELESDPYCACIPKKWREIGPVV